MPSPRCDCGYGQQEDCARWGHVQGARLDHDRIMRNLDRAQKRVRKFKRAMGIFFPYIDASEADSALSALFQEMQTLRRTVQDLKAKYEPGADPPPVPAPLYCEGCGDLATRATSAGVPICALCTEVEVFPDEPDNPY